MDTCTRRARGFERIFHRRKGISIDQRTDERLGRARIADGNRLVNRHQLGDQPVVNLLMHDQPPQVGAALSGGVRGAWACVKPMLNRKRIPAFSPSLYRYRNLVERFFNKLKHRAVATRYDKRDDNFLASVQLASIRIWLRHNESVT